MRVFLKVFSGLLGAFRDYFQFFILLSFADFIVFCNVVFRVKYMKIKIDMTLFDLPISNVLQKLAF